MDRAIYVVSIFGPIMTLPQLFKIWTLKSAIGISITSWIAFLVVAIFWLIYGMMHNEKPIIFSSILWTIAQVAVVG